MRPQLETIYESLYDDYRYGFSLRDYQNQPLIRIIQRTIQDTEEIFKRSAEGDIPKIRSDAKYFLVVIFNQMVALPLSLENRIDEVKGISTLYEDITEDISFLLKEGFRDKADAAVKEITAHTILTLMDGNWHRLAISKFELWNKKR